MVTNILRNLVKAPGYECLYKDNMFEVVRSTGKTGDEMHGVFKYMIFSVCFLRVFCNHHPMGKTYHANIRDYTFSNSAMFPCC